jgi:outer membrane protein assembly factor BamB
MKTSVLLCSLSLSIFNLPVHGQWPDWRGPNGNGAIKEGTLLMEFSAEGKGVVWKTALPGRGCSTPIVVKDLLFLTAPIEGKDSILAFDLEGKEMWRQSFSEETPGRGQKVGSGANSSAVSDGETVVAYFKSGLVAACSRDGKKKWEKNLQKEYGETTLWWDQGTSPVLFEQNVIIAVMQTEGDSYLVSLDLMTGAEKWKTERKFKTAKESGDSYTTPHLLTIEGVATVVSFGADHITGHDAKTGKLLWTSGGINPENEGMWRTIASSVEVDGIVVVPHGRGEYLMALKAGGEGDVTDENVLWRKKMMNTDSSTPVARDGKVIILIDRGKERGTILCLEAKTGEMLWEGKLPKSAKTFYSSPILVGDTLCCPREDGVVFMAKITDEGLGEVKESKLEQSFIASPIYVDGKLILRGNDFLWCLK